MNELKQYIMSVVGAALVCGVIKSLVSGSGMKAAVVNMMCGLFVAITALTPVLKIEIPDLHNYINPISDTANEITQQAVTSTRQDMARIIMEEVRAYILEKANSLNMNIDVEVKLDDKELTPIGAIIVGSVSPYEKTVLGEYMERTLDIPEEKQQWME